MDTFLLNQWLNKLLRDITIYVLNKPVVTVNISCHYVKIVLLYAVIYDPPCQNDAPCVAKDTCKCSTGFTGPTCAG